MMARRVRNRELALFMGRLSEIESGFRAVDIRNPSEKYVERYSHYHGASKTRISDNPATHRCNSHTLLTISEFVFNEKLWRNALNFAIFLE